MTRAWGVAWLRRLAAFLLSVVAVAAMGGCSLLGGSTEDGGGNAKVERAKVKVGVIPKLIDIAGFKRAQQAGYFAREGLEIEEVPIKSATEAVPRLKTGELQFAFGNWTTFILAHKNQEADLRFIADGFQAKEGLSGLCALPGSGITTPKDLAGKTVGINALRGNVELSVRAILDAHQVDQNSVEFKVIPTSEALNALATKQIDVMSLQQPNLEVAKQTLEVTVVADRATGPMHDFPVAGYVTLTPFTNDNPKTVAAFQRAIRHGQEDVADDQTLEETLLAYTDIEPNTAKNVVATVEAGVFPTSLDRTNLQRVADLMDEYGILTTRFDVGPMIYTAPGS